MPKLILKTLTCTLILTLTLIGCQQNVNDNAETNLSESGIPAKNNNDTQTILQATQQNTPSEASASLTKQATTTDTITTQPITILALGDSLTEGLGLAARDAYPAQLQMALQKTGYTKVQVVNSGLSGETTTGLVNRLDWALKTKPDITILTIGANDAMRGIAVATVEQNLRTAIERLQSEGCVVILGGMQIYDNLGNDYVQAFSDIYPKLAKEYNVAFIPFFLNGVAGDLSLNQADAIHPNKKGYGNIVANNILPVLEPALEKLVESNNTK